MKTIEESLKTISKSVAHFPETLLVLGSGWNKVLDEVDIKKRISYDDLFGVKATVPGHDGELLVGTIQEKAVACMSGRFHMYEGFSGYEATVPIRLFAKLGMKNLILTAACGALNEKYKVGDFIVLSDMITLFLAIDSPLKGAQFVDVSEVFDKEMRNRATEICVKNKIPFHEGIYVYYHGPNYETPADKMALKFLGADVCGMSTVPETLVARSFGIKVLGLSFVTNLAFVKHNHAEVVQQANNASEKMRVMLKDIVAAI